MAEQDVHQENGHPPEPGNSGEGWPRRGKAFRRAALWGGLLGLMLLAPMVFLVGTGVKIARDPDFVPAPRAEKVTVDLFQKPARREPEAKAEPLTPEPLDHGIAAMLAVPSSTGGLSDTYPFTLHVGSFRNAARAAAQVNALRELGGAAFSAYVTIPGMGDWYRVFCGNFASREEAEAARETLLAQGGSEASLTKKSVALAVEGPLPVSDALALESRLHALGFFAYVMPRPPADGRVQVLVGAFQTESRAGVMRKRLTKAGFEARTVRR